MESPENAQEMTGCSIWCHGLVDKGEIDQRLHFIIIEAFPNLIILSMILWFYFPKSTRRLYTRNQSNKTIDAHSYFHLLFVFTPLELPLSFLLIPLGSPTAPSKWRCSGSLTPGLSPFFGGWPSRTGCREGATKQSYCCEIPGKFPSGRDAVMGKGSLHGVSITQEKCHEAAEPGEVLGCCWLRSVWLLHCVVSVHKGWRGAVAAWGHPGTTGGTQLQISWVSLQSLG